YPTLCRSLGGAAGVGKVRVAGVVAPLEVPDGEGDEPVGVVRVRLGVLPEEGAGAVEVGEGGVGPPEVGVDVAELFEEDGPEVGDGEAEAVGRRPGGEEGEAAPVAGEGVLEAPEVAVVGVALDVADAEVRLGEVEAERRVVAGFQGEAVE